MFYRIYLFFFTIIFITNCTSLQKNDKNVNLIFEKGFTNKGFALLYTDNLYKKKIISKKLDHRSLIIFQKNLKKNSFVKITNPTNQISLIAKVGKKSSYPNFNNSVISSRIANELKLDLKEPYIEILSINENSTFIANRTKTYDEEKQVADTAPVDSISINDLNPIKKIKKNTKKNFFSYNIKIADFYFNKSALSMVSRIKNETNVKNPKVEKISDKKYRVYLGPFTNINSLQSSFNDINILGFENIEIIKHD
jgi:hypothetical protein